MDQKNDHQELEAFTVREAAEVLRLSETQIRRMIRAGALPAARVGARPYRVRREALEQILEPRQREE